MRYSPFARDLHAIHGNADFRVISDGPAEAVAAIPALTRYGMVFLLCVGVAALAVIVLAMVAAIVIFVYSAFVPYPTLDAHLISEPVRSVLA